MLREITINELFRSGEPIYFLNTITGTIVPAEDLFMGVRILRDEPEAVKKPLMEHEVEAKRKRRTKTEIRDTVLKCWNKGEKTAAQIAKETGIDYKTVRNYIPTSKEG